MAWVYLLRCNDGTLYCGSTRNLDDRLRQHAVGKGAEYTSTRLPVQLVWSQEFDRVDDAWAMERKLHGWSRRKREALIRGDWDEIRRLSKSRTTGTG